MLLKENNQLHDDRFPIAAQRGVFQKKNFKCYLLHVFTRVSRVEINTRAYGPTFLRFPSSSLPE